MDALGVGVGTGLIHITEGMNCPQDELPDKHHPETSFIFHPKLIKQREDTATSKERHEGDYMDYRCSIPTVSHGS